jgi:hypothetical protein
VSDDSSAPSLIPQATVRRRTQQQITDFFIPVGKPVSGLIAPMATEIPLAPPSVVMAGPRCTRKSMIRDKLLHYNYDFTSSYRPITCPPSVCPPPETLADSWELEELLKLYVITGLLESLTGVKTPGPLVICYSSR